MIAIGGIRVPFIEELPENELHFLIKKIMDFAKANPQGPERETFDFKKEINLANEQDKFELRKHFSSFANTKGGLIIVGIDEKQDFKVTGVSNIPKDEQLNQILSSEFHIRPPVSFSSRAIPYQDKTILLYYIPENYNLPVEVRKGGDSA